ncbi:MAG: DUF3667 domain-containing protein [Ferruginibacter sp.]
MSHLKERSEKNCLNCNAVVHGKFCHVCGQENLHPQETTWHLISHFFQDITHFDGKFFSTLKYLLVKPGFLTSEYKYGRRASYLNPIRMYLFTSAIFFLIFFSTTDVGDKIVNTTYHGKTEAEVEKMDSLEFRKFTAELNDGKLMSKDQFMRYMDTSAKGGLHFSTDHYKSKTEYDSLLKIGKVHDGWFDRILNYKEIEMREKYHNNQKVIFKEIGNNLLHSFPQIFFISLPIFAFILRLLYFRRKNFYYTSHVIFSIHFYVLVFIMLLIVIGLNAAMDFSGWKFFGYLIIPVFLYIFYYQYKSLRNFYMQRRAKTIFKFLLLNIAVLFTIGLLMIVFMLFSIMKI